MFIFFFPNSFTALPIIAQQLSLILEALKWDLVSGSGAAALNHHKDLLCLLRQSDSGAGFVLEGVLTVICYLLL